MKSVIKIGCNIATISIFLLISACSKPKGCTDSNACNYNKSAEVDDGNCEYISCKGGNCDFTQWSGTANCSQSDYFPVYTGICCSANYPYYNTGGNKCYSSCASAQSASSGAVYKIKTGGGNTGNCFVLGSVGTSLSCSPGFVPITYSPLSIYSCCPSAQPYYCSSTKTCYSTCLSVPSNCGSIVKGSSNGGGNNPGKITVWVSDLQYVSNGNSITVNCAGQSGSVTRTYSQTPNCGASYCATFTLNPGSYSVSATCPIRNWSAQNFNLQDGECKTIHLN